jgi:hypothetical protein
MMPGGYSKRSCCNTDPGFSIALGDGTADTNKGSPVTVQFSSSAILSMKTNSGNDPAHLVGATT